MDRIEIIQDTGYGLIPRKIMRNKNLSMQAKAIYSYLASFAGNTGRAFPSTNLMADELGISRNTLFKYLKELRTLGAISVEREITSYGIKGKNIYYLHNEIENPRSTKKRDIDNRDIAKRDIVKRDTVNQYTNSNNSNSNIFNNNICNSNSQSVYEEVLPQYNKPTYSIYTRFINNLIGQTRLESYTEQESLELKDQVIKEMVKDIFEQTDGWTFIEDKEKNLIMTGIESILKESCSDNVFNRLLKSTADSYSYALDRYNEALMKNTIKNRPAYWKKVLKNSIDEYVYETIDDVVKRDLYYK